MFQYYAMLFQIMWRRKVPSNIKHLRAKRNAKITATTKVKLNCTKDVNSFCDKMKKSERVRKFLLRKVDGEENLSDLQTDYRRKKPEDQVPEEYRSGPPTPPAYWILADPGSPPLLKI